MEILKENQKVVAIERIKNYFGGSFPAGCYFNQTTEGDLFDSHGAPFHEGWYDVTVYEVVFGTLSILFYSTGEFKGTCANTQI